MQLRMTLAELGMVTIPSLFPIPHVQNAFDDEGTPAQAYTGESFKPFLDEFLWYANALREARRVGVPES